jgi:hypothetical protein
VRLNTKTENGLSENMERDSFAILHEAMGDGAFAVFQIRICLLDVLCICWVWPVPDAWRTMDLEETGSIASLSSLVYMFSKRCRDEDYAIDRDYFATLAGLWVRRVRIRLCRDSVLLGPVHLCERAWFCTWLQHTDPSVPHYNN